MVAPLRALDSIYSMDGGRLIRPPTTGRLALDSPIPTRDRYGKVWEVYEVQVQVLDRGVYEISPLYEICVSIEI